MLLGCHEMWVKRAINGTYEKDLHTIKYTILCTKCGLLYDHIVDLEEK